MPNLSVIAVRARQSGKMPQKGIFFLFESFLGVLLICEILYIFAIINYEKMGQQLCEKT